jgi:hypothetical protein
MLTRPDFTIESDWEVTNTVADTVADYLDLTNNILAQHAALRIDGLRPDRRSHEDGEDVESIGMFVMNPWCVALDSKRDTAVLCFTPCVALYTYVMYTGTAHT